MIQKILIHPGLMPQACNPTTWEAEARGFYRFKAALVSFEDLYQNKKLKKGSGYSAAVKYLLSMQEAVG